LAKALLEKGRLSESEVIAILDRDHFASELDLRS
jgi:hypothetical protein